MQYPIGKISKICVYPVKALGRIGVTTAFLTPYGLTTGYYADHQFMVVRAEPDREGVHQFLTQRDMRTNRGKPQELSI